MPQLSSASNRLVGQKMFQILAEAQSLERMGREVFHFEIGEPDFITPPNISKAAVNAILAGETRYVNSMGLLELRKAAADTTLRSRGFEPAIEQILVTPGANIQIYLAVACAVNPGEEVIIPDPGFVSYASIIEFLGAIPVRVPLREENDFCMSPGDVVSAITQKTRMIITNSPSNPTGSVLSAKHVKELFDIANNYDLFLLSDEIYARMVYKNSQNKFSSPSKFDQCKTNTIIINGFSKAYSMTGWRLGVVTGPIEIIRKMGLLLETLCSCTSPFTQVAGIEALQGSQEVVEGMIGEYERRRDLLVSGLNTLPGITCKVPDGAFYVFPNIKATGKTSEEMAKFLMDKAGVIVSPGTIFGNYGEGYIRFCYANSVENIEKAINKMRVAMC